MCATTQKRLATVVLVGLGPLMLLACGVLAGSWWMASIGVSGLACGLLAMLEP